MTSAEPTSSGTTSAGGSSTSVDQPTGGTTSGGPDDPVTGSSSSSATATTMLDLPGSSSTTGNLTAASSVGDESTTGCGGELYQADEVPPNVLITLDRSGSMHDLIDGGLTKWNVALAAIDQLTAQYDDQVYFGLSLFPGFDQGCATGQACGPGAVFIDPAPGAAAQIDTFLAGAGTCSFGTPLAEHVASLIDYSGLEDLSRPNYVLLITDGQATCADPVPPVAALRLEAPEVKTFVVGFGSGVDPTQLNNMAMAGGTAAPGDPKYYQADDAMTLQDAFAAIVGDVLSCTYALQQVPPNDDELYVLFNGVLVTRDFNHVDGWDYDPVTNTITFYGPACEAVKSAESEALQIVFGCPNPG